MKWIEGDEEKRRREIGERLKKFPMETESVTNDEGKALAVSMES